MGADASTVKLERDTRPALEFQGWKLAHLSTHLAHKLRWTELTIWAVDDSDRALWVVEVVGRTTVDGEVDRRDAIPCSDVEALRAALSRDGTLTSPGWLVLQDAAREDDVLAQMLNTERTEKL